jgi:hypothetical protein
MLTMVMVMALAPAAVPQPDTFTAETELQGLYEEISEAVMHATAGVETVRPVLYSADWEFIDAAGQHQSWPQVSVASSVSAFRAAPFDVIRHVIQKLTIQGNVATVVVQVTIETDESRVDAYAAQLPRARDQTTTFRDTWVKNGDAWKMKSSQQIGKSQVRPAALY